MRHLALLALLACGPVFAQGTATLTWDPPTQYQNGDPLDPLVDLTEYRIYVNGAQFDVVADPSVAIYVVELSPGTYDFNVTAVADNGNESPLSNTDSKVIPDTRTPAAPTLFEAVIAFLRRVLFEWWA